MTDHTETLISAWLAWERAPGHRPVCIARIEAVKAAGLPVRETHELMGAARRAGMAIPDAVQTVIHHFAPLEAA